MSSKQSTSGPSAKKRKLDDEFESSGPEQKSFLPVIIQKWHNSWHEIQSKNENQKLFDDAIKRLAEIEKAKEKEINDLKLKLEQEKLKTEQADSVIKDVICEMIFAGSKKRTDLIAHIISKGDLLTECVLTNNPAAMSLLIRHKSKFIRIGLEAYHEQFSVHLEYSAFNNLWPVSKFGHF